MARFIKLDVGFDGRECVYLNCEQVVAMYPVETSTGGPFAVNVVTTGSVGGYLPERYDTQAEACAASGAFADRLEKCRS